MRDTITKLLFMIVMLTASGAAFAHPGHNISGLVAGLTHPFSGMDHLLAMVAVGLWAAQGSGRTVWMLPATFMITLSAGAGAAMLWHSAPMVESGLAVSVLVLGVLAALSMQLPAALSVAITALFGLLHGYAHGLELPQSAAPATYALGFLAATASLHISGITVVVTSRKHCALLSRLAGSAIAMSGAYLLAAG